MKLYPDYKKLFSIIILFFLFLFPVAISYAETAQEIQNKINQKDSDIRKLEQEIAAYQAQLDDLGQQKNSLKSSLKQLDLTRKKLNADITVTQKKIDKTNLTIQNLSFDIGSKQNQINNDLDAIELGLRQMNESEQSGILQTLLSQNDFTVIWNDIDNITSVHDKIRDKIINLKQVKNDLEDTRRQTINAKNQLTKLRSQLSDQQKIVIQNTKEKNKLLAQTKNSEANYQKLLKDRLAKKEAFERELEEYESQLKYILDPSKLPSGKVLSWPLDSILITSSYGSRNGGFHYGIDFRARTPLPVYAMADGIVDGIGDTDIQCPGVSFGRFVLIKYNNGLASTFGHLSLIKAQKGNKVTKGQIIGYSGNTGYSTAPHLHISIYARDAVEIKTIPSKSCPGRVLTQPVSPTNGYLNPLKYLPSTTASMFK